MIHIDLDTITRDSLEGSRTADLIETSSYPLLDASLPAHVSSGHMQRVISAYISTFV